MLSVMMSHVDNLGSLSDCTESSLHDLLGLSYESHHGTVGGGTGIDVQELYTLYTLGGVGNLFDNLHIASLAEVGNALDKFTCHVG